jgi:molybdopterin synthase catalytic subunit
LHYNYYKRVKCMIKITDKPIDVNVAIQAASSLEAGGINVFIGTVRNITQDKKVRWLEYESYETMAINEIKKIIESAKRKWDLKGYAVIHRTGTLHPNETAVVIAVACGHRKESFEACQFIIDELKKHVPIFKKEVFEDGAEWVSARA